MKIDLISFLVSLFYGHFENGLTRFLLFYGRYLAIRHPIEYRNSTMGINPWKSAIKSLALVLVTAALFTFPLYLETSVKHTEIGRLHEVNETHFKYVSNT